MSISPLNSNLNINLHVRTSLEPPPEFLQASFYSSLDRHLSGCINKNLRLKSKHIVLSIGPGCLEAQSSILPIVLTFISKLFSSFLHYFSFFIDALLDPCFKTGWKGLGLKSHRGTLWITWWSSSNLFQRSSTQPIEQISSSNSPNQYIKISHITPSLHIHFFPQDLKTIPKAKSILNEVIAPSTFFFTFSYLFYSILSLSKQLTKLHILSSLLFPFSPFLFPLYNFKFFSLWFLNSFQLSFAVLLLYRSPYLI